MKRAKLGTRFPRLRARGPGWLATAALLIVALVGFRPAVADAQQGTVAGTVTAEGSLRPLAGAQVTVEGTTRGTLTDASGRFVLPGLSGQQVNLRVVMLGFRSATRTVQVGETNVQIRLAESAVALDEVVITGTVGGTERRAIGNAVSTIRAAETVELAPIPNLQSLINARAPGVLITPGTGQVGSGSQIRIRGSSSLSLSNTPLLVVDGVRVDNAQNSGPVNQAFGSSIISRINDFNPDDIESIEIIKGPAAATLYGTEAANGVIQIITRRGATGAPTLDFTMRQGGNWFANAEGRVPTNFWRNPSGQVESINFAQTEAARGNPLWRTGHLQNYNLSLSGGTAEIRYHLSGHLDREEGPDWDNDLRRGGARANITVTPSDRVQVVGTMGYVGADFSLACEGGCGGPTWASYFSTPFHFGTNDPNRVRLEDGTDRRRGGRSFVPEYYWNVTSRTQDLGRFTGSVQATHTPISWFSHRVTFGLDDTREDNQTLTEITDLLLEWSPTSVGGKDVERRELNTRTLDYSGTFTARPFPALTSRTSFGAQYYNRMLRLVTASGADFGLPGLRVVNATNAERRSSAERFEETVSLGIFGQQEFGWDERRFLTLGLRADDHSAFGEEFTMVYYPKISAAWVVSEEPFWRFPAVSELRLRTAFGMAGEQPGAFDALRTFIVVAGPAGGGSTVTPRTIGNPELGPERGQELEVGFDAGFLGGRLGAEVTWYNQRTRDAIILQPIAPSTGFPGSRFQNIGELRNFGYELMLRAQPLVRRNFAWDATFSLSRNDSEVINIGDQEEIQLGFGITHRPGFPIASWFGRRIVDAQFDPNTDAVIQSSMMCDNGQGGTVACYTGNTITAPRVFLGRSDPLNEGAFSSTFTLFDRFRVYGLMDFKRGFKKWDHVTRVRCSLNNTCLESRQTAGTPGFVDPSIKQSERFQNDPSYRAMLASYQRADNFGDTYINDSGFLRLREVSVSYTVPGQFAQRFGARRASLSVAARNLYTFSDWTGMDPEARFLGGTRGLFGGFEQNHLPQSTSLVTSVNLSF